MANAHFVSHLSEFDAELADVGLKRLHRVGELLLLILETLDERFLGVLSQLDVGADHLAQGLLDLLRALIRRVDLVIQAISFPRHIISSVRCLPPLISSLSVCSSSSVLRSNLTSIASRIAFMYLAD